MPTLTTRLQSTYALQDIPHGVLSTVVEWMQAMNQQELTISISENKVTLKGTSFFRTTI